MCRPASWLLPCPSAFRRVEYQAFHSGAMSWCRTYGGLPMKRVLPFTPGSVSVRKSPTTTSRRCVSLSAAAFARRMSASTGSCSTAMARAFGNRRNAAKVKRPEPAPGSTTRAYVVDSRAAQSSMPRTTASGVLGAFQPAIGRAQRVVTASDGAGHPCCLRFIPAGWDALQGSALGLGKGDPAHERAHDRQQFRD